MRKRYVFLMVICLVLFGQCLIWAQASASSGVPKVVWMFREDVKVARGMVHDRVETAFARLWAKDKCSRF